jgi:hypothetical protein
MDVDDVYMNVTYVNVTDNTQEAPEAMWARRVTLSGPPDALDDRKVTLVSNLFVRFSQQVGHGGGHLMVQRDRGVICATSFWETSSAMDRTMESARSAAQQMCQTIWGSTGRWELEVFQVIGLKPALRSIAIPHL